MIFFAFCAGFISGDDLKRFCVGSSKLICIASSYDNRLISFAIFSSTHLSTLFAFSCQICTILTHFQRKALKQFEQSPRKKDTLILWCTRLRAFSSYFTWMNSKHDLIPREKCAYNW